MIDNEGNDNMSDIISSCASNHSFDKKRFIQDDKLDEKLNDKSNL